MKRIMNTRVFSDGTWNPEYDYCATEVNSCSVTATK